MSEGRPGGPSSSASAPDENARKGCREESKHRSRGVPACGTRSARDSRFVHASDSLRGGGKAAPMDCCLLRPREAEREFDAGAGMPARKEDGQISPKCMDAERCFLVTARVRGFMT